MARKNEGEMIELQVDGVRAVTGVDIKTVNADVGDAYARLKSTVRSSDAASRS